MGSVAVAYVAGFRKIGSGIQKLLAVKEICADGSFLKFLFSGVRTTGA
jgi:hypothetical protein